MSQRTLHDLIHSKACLQVVCCRCRHGGLVYPFDIGRMLPWTATIEDVRPLLRCSQCNSRSVTIYEASR